MNSILWSKKQAQRWQEGFPLGNGRMGVMCYGGFPVETLELSDSTFFSGEMSENNNRENAAWAFRKMRALTEEGELAEAVKASEGFIGIRQNYGTNLPVGKLKIIYQANPIKKYERKLDLNCGITSAAVETKQNILYTESFVSYEDQSFFMKILDKGQMKFSIKIKWEAYGKHSSIHFDPAAICFQEKAIEPLHSDGRSGVTLTGRCEVFTSEGVCRFENNALIVEQAREIYIRVHTDTDFSYSGIKRQEAPDLKAVTPKNYQKIKERHIRDFETRMSRVRFSLQKEEKEENMTIEEHLEYIRQASCDNGLTELLFQYGRYLLLSSSRERSPLPAHLQGVWNDNVACRIGWTCDMHLDINTQMNYWLSEPGNLSECHVPLFQWMKQVVVPSGRKSARISYGQKGWSADLVSNAWGYTAPYWSPTISPCPTGGIWMASDYVEHYRYGKDRGFLIGEAFPIISEAVDFFEEYVFEDQKGRLSCGPSISPENSFYMKNEVYFFSNGSTYEILMIRELFREYLELCNEMGDAIPDKDQMRIKKIEEYLRRLIPYRITDRGTIAEWDKDYKEADRQHRHTSHLLGLFPYHQICPENMPELAGAVKKTIQEKLTPEDQWEDTGWARSLLLLYSARLKDAQMAYEHLLSMQKNLLCPNLMVMHPPTRGAQSFMEVYELDGNTGCSMGVIEMLVQSQDEVIRLLPCLPLQWETGAISGIKARSGIELSVSWEKGELSEAVFLSQTKQEVRVEYREKRWSLFLEKDKKTVIRNEFPPCEK
ncbi:MAG: glycoside hydrolase N-terminal domain-containing protein [Lachnospiraceae bacterium]